MRRSLYDIAALIARVVVGVVFMAHGLQKATDLGGTIEGFERLGVVFPQITATATTVIEIGAGALLIAGLLTPVAGLLLVLVAVGALVYVHWPNGVFVAEGGWELVGALGAAALVLAAAGAGRFSVDYILFGRGAAEPADTRPFSFLASPRHRDRGGEGDFRG